MRRSVDITRNYQFWRMMLNHMIAVIVAFVIQIAACWYYFDKTIIKYIISIIFIISYSYMIYSGAHKLASMDAKSYTSLKPEMKWGVLWGIAIAVTIFIAITVYFLNYKFFSSGDGESLNNWGSVAVNIMIIIWMSPYMGFLFNNGINVWIIAGAASVIAVVSSTLGYAAGINNFDIWEKLDSLTIEKEDEEDDEDKNIEQ